MAFLLTGNFNYRVRNPCNYSTVIWLSRDGASPSFIQERPSLNKSATLGQGFNIFFPQQKNCFSALPCRSTTLKKKVVIHCPAPKKLVLLQWGLLTSRGHANTGSQPGLQQQLTHSVDHVKAGWPILDPSPPEITSIPEVRDHPQWPAGIPWCY